VASDGINPLAVNPHASAIAVNTRLLDLFVNGFTFFPA
jgi:hypothetical protein